MTKQGTKVTGFLSRKIVIAPSSTCPSDGIRVANGVVGGVGGGGGGGGVVALGCDMKSNISNLGVITTCFSVFFFFSVFFMHFLILSSTSFVELFLIFPSAGTVFGFLRLYSSKDFTFSFAASGK